VEEISQILEELFKRGNLKKKVWKFEDKEGEN
jgi:hypothetical protein